MEMETKIKKIDDRIYFTGFDGREKEAVYCYFPFEWGVTWISGEYPQPPDFRGQEWRLAGRSGIASRNTWVIESIVVVQ